jgi:Sel1 repeat
MVLPRLVEAQNPRGMSDPTGNLEPDVPDGSAESDEPAVSLDRLAGLFPHDAQPACPRCQTDLSHVAPAARFCPRCGLNLCPPSGVPPVPVVPLLPSEELARTARSRVEDWMRLRDRLDGAPAVVAPTPPMSAESRSLIVLGYSNAMYRLGWRYETGNGTGRNADEAVRCYFKAAKLGNPAALARLAPRCADDPAPPPPLPTTAADDGSEPSGSDAASSA